VQVEHNRWDDVVDQKNESNSRLKKPKFHLLIPAPDTNATANLCKTLSSAAILNYPPPTLIHYGNEEKTFSRPGADIVRNIFSFLLGKEAHGDDLILVVEEGIAHHSNIEHLSNVEQTVGFNFQQRSL